MRTTLKRGYGRVVDPNGNGRPRGPPAAPTPVARYRQPEPPRRGFARTMVAIFGWFVIIVLVLSAGLGGGVYLWVHDLPTKIAASSPDVIKSVRQLRVPEAGKPATALVIGYDHR